MPSQQYYCLGHIQRILGPQELVITEPASFKQRLTEPPTKIYVYQLATYVPYSVVSWNYTNRSIRCKVHLPIANKDLSPLKGCQVFVSTQLLVTDQGVNLGGHACEQWINYWVEDERQGVLGRIVAVYDRPLQPLLELETGTQAFLLPFHTSFFKKVEHVAEKLWVCLPFDHTSLLACT